VILGLPGGRCMAGRWILRQKSTNLLTTVIITVVVRLLLLNNPGYRWCHTLATWHACTVLQTWLLSRIQWHHHLIQRRRLWCWQSAACRSVCEAEL